MRLRWFKNLNPTIRLLILAGLILIFSAFYIPFSKYIKPAIVSLLSSPLKITQAISFNAGQFLKFEDKLLENKRLKKQLDKLSGQLLTSEELRLENRRLRALLSLPQKKSFRTTAALLIGKDSSSWTNVAFINKGTSNGIKKGMPVILEMNLVGKVIEAAPGVSKVRLIVDFNSKIPAKILRSREEGVVFGTGRFKHELCKMKYIQGEVEPGDKIVSSGLGGIYPKGLLIGEVTAVEEEKNGLYKVAEVRPAVDFSTLEEIMVITDGVGSR